ncbi:hypothetical protein D5F11_015745 [Siminovitchia terrae]|uniref:UvrABC system protein A n=1 Tax=Siminovitchia terrae TaxID=1914933 RepID=A0A429X604_SIMTE|nr:hypothetical protein [Siminovitchia terrae]RST58693.1 hypothetical protein D5F11_015745 [Siminovitchia terrae]
MVENQYIKLVGLKENNLKNVTLTIPKKKITVFTGVSGSGKSSIVFDTISKEAQRQLNQTFTTYIQNRLPTYSQPDALSIENLSPAVVIDQRHLGGKCTFNAWYGHRYLLIIAIIILAYWKAIYWRI